MPDSPDPPTVAPPEPALAEPAPGPALNKSDEAREKHNIDGMKKNAEDKAGSTGESEGALHSSDESESPVKTSESVEATDDGSSAPPLPDELPPPLPAEAPPTTEPEDDGWIIVWEENYQAYYFFNNFTGISQWENPRVPATPNAPIPAAPGTEPQPESSPKKEPVIGGYNPSIHGNYDPTADYARQYEEQSEQTQAGAVNPTETYAATGAFNRFTGRWQAADINPENHNDENKSRRQMNAFFDVDAAANSHDGRSLRAERSSRKPTKAEVKQFKEKRREKKEEKRRAWLRD